MKFKYTIKSQSRHRDWYQEIRRRRDLYSTARFENQLPYKERVKLILAEIDRFGGLVVNRSGAMQTTFKGTFAHDVKQMIKEKLIKRVKVHKWWTTNHGITMLIRDEPRSLSSAGRTSR